MKIKSRVWHWLAVACGSVGLVLGMGAEGTAQTGGTISDSQFSTAMALILAGLALMRISFAVQDADERAHRKVHKEPRNTVKGKRKVG